MDYQKLFEHMSKVYGLTLLESELREIVNVVSELKEEKSHQGQSVVEEIIQWAKENHFDVEDQAGVKYLALDFEEMEQNFSKWLTKENKSHYYVGRAVRTAIGKGTIDIVDSIEGIARVTLKNGTNVFWFCFEDIELL